MKYLRMAGQIKSGDLSKLAVATKDEAYKLHGTELKKLLPLTENQKLFLDQLFPKEKMEN